MDFRASCILKLRVRNYGSVVGVFLLLLLLCLLFNPEGTRQSLKVSAQGSDVVSIG